MTCKNLVAIIIPLERGTGCDNINSGLIKPKKLTMKRFVAFLTFRIGVDILGFPMYWHHQVFFTENYYLIGKRSIQNVDQFITKQY